MLRYGRALVACLAGYTIIAACMSGVVFGASRLFGTEWLLQPESWRVSYGWIAVSIVAAIVGPLLGGMLCKILDRRGHGIVFLLVAIVGLGLFSVPAEEPAERTEAPTVLSLQSHAVAPMWTHVLLSLQSALVVFMASRRIAGSAADSAPRQPVTCIDCDSRADRKV